MKLLQYEKIGRSVSTDSLQEQPNSLTAPDGRPEKVPKIQVGIPSRQKGFGTMNFLMLDIFQIISIS